MRVTAVALRLSGPAPAAHLQAWVRALGRVAAERRVLHLPDSYSDADAPPELPRWLADAGVEHAADVPTDACDVVVVARAGDLPTPTSLRRLVSEAAGGSEPCETRVLPHGTESVDGQDVPAPHVCVAVPSAAPLPCRQATGPDGAYDAAAAAGTGVRLVPSAAVFTDRGRETRGAAAPLDPDPPYGHPAALPATALHRVLLDSGLTPPALPAGREPRPFLTVLTRTQGTRLQCLEEVLTCLAAQTSHDFEVVIACHRVDADALARVHALLDDLPPWLRERTRVLEVTRPGRSSPLNDALDVARGRYAVMLDDDDAVAADWVRAFAELEAHHPGVVLRSVALGQEVRPVTVEDEDGPRGPVAAEAGPAHRIWPEQFRMTDHLWDNASPPMTFAVPRGVFDDLGRRFDESLHTTEDWDFLLQAATLTGVASTPAVTATYRVWTDGEGSRHLHDSDEWAAGREAILARLDDRVVLLPPGGAREVRDLRTALDAETAEKFRFAQLNEQAAADLRTVNDAVVALRERIAVLEERLERRRQRRRD